MNKRFWSLMNYVPFILIVIGLALISNPTDILEILLSCVIGISMAFALIKWSEFCGKKSADFKDKEKK